MRKHNLKIALGLSGGVDSAVSLFLLKKWGFDVTAIFLKTYEPPKDFTGECHWKEDLDSAQRVANFLNVKFESWNLQKEYEESVLAYYFSELKNGRTPNPDAVCNSDIKFGAFNSRALSKGYDAIATGHYAQIICNINKTTLLLRGVDSSKDQSYFLSRVPVSQFSNVLFPLGAFIKKQVRALAKAIKLPNAERPDSQGICFLGIEDVNQFNDYYLHAKKGVIREAETGKIIGEHSGLHHYTIGQREGIKIGGTKEPYFVVKKDVKNNELVISLGKTNPLLYKKTCLVTDVLWAEDQNIPTFSCDTQIRYQQKPQKASVTKIQPQRYRVDFFQEQRAITPGQVIVFYKNQVVLGSGIIE